VITLEEAQGMISAAERKAQQMGQPMNIAVMDAGRNLVAFHRMDGAWVASIDIAIDKAFTSAGEVSPQERSARWPSLASPFSASTPRTAVESSSSPAASR
jgi:uncharacterized protein GlcG (DUF336 family)